MAVTATSVIRFGKILQIWQKFKSFWLFLEGLFCILQNFEPTLATNGHIFIVENGQIWNKLFSHLVTLAATESVCFTRLTTIEKYSVNS